MVKKRLKLARGISDYVPVSVNFSELESEMEENEVAFEPSDDSLEVKRMEDNLEYEEMIVQILSNFEMREKLIFIYQLLRDGGYQIDHASFAKTLNISRRQYMRILDNVRVKSALLIYGYQSRKG